MSSSNVSSVTNHFSTANEGFITTTSGTVSSGATTVGLNSVSGLTNGTIFVGIIEPGVEAKEQTFTGVVDTAGTQITGVKWTRGSNTAHSAGSTVVDYVSGTGHNMMTKGLLEEHAQDGTHTDITADSLTVSGTSVLTGAVTLPDSTITTAKINDDAVTPAKWTNPYCFRAYASGATTLTDATFVKVAFATETYDYNSNYDTSTSRYTAPVTGVYHFCANIQISGAVSTGVLFQLEGRKNGSTDTIGPLYTPVDFAAINITFDTLLAAGEYMEIFCQQNSAGNETTSTGATGTIFTGHLVHAT